MPGRAKTQGRDGRLCKRYPEPIHTLTLYATCNESYISNMMGISIKIHVPRVIAVIISRACISHQKVYVDAMLERGSPGYPWPLLLLPSTRQVHRRPVPSARKGITILSGTASSMLAQVQQGSPRWVGDLCQQHTGGVSSLRTEATNTTTGPIAC